MSKNKTGPKPKPKNEVCDNITVYIKRQRLIDIGKGNLKQGRAKARKIAKDAVMNQPL